VLSVEYLPESVQLQSQENFCRNLTPPGIFMEFQIPWTLTKLSNVVVVVENPEGYHLGFKTVYKIYTLSDITWSDITLALEAFAPIIMSAQIMSDQIVSAHDYVH
jgi:hypothetical protein